MAKTLIVPKVWMIVELFGHQRIAGRFREEEIGGASFIRIDVPETSKRDGFTKYFGASAIYAMTPVDEETAKLAAEAYQNVPVETWQLKNVLQHQLAAVNPIDADDEIDFGDPNREDDEEVDW